jgi:hypothetical protein
MAWAQGAQSHPEDSEIDLLVLRVGGEGGEGEQGGGESDFHGRAFP